MKGINQLANISIKIIDTDSPMDYLNNKTDNPNKLISVAVCNMVSDKFMGKPITDQMHEDMRLYVRDCFLWFVNQGII